ncbi:hypothetical protein A9174_24960 [Mesorhizobium loti NZP2037]|nr:hypothetical protein [Mesorhizobium loti]ANN59645.1 hypothetical protein A9174_24960 [Mesorhizobium loti NZP2037]
MVATVGSIAIDLTTNASKFADGFRQNATTVEQQSARMAKAVGTVERNVASMAGSLKTFGTGLAAGAGLAAVASLGGAFEKLKQTISEYDKIATDSKTAGLRPDTFQALTFAAKQANIEYDSINSSLDIFAKNAGLAANGQGALYAGLRNLNPQLLQAILNTKDQEERLKLVADAMANTTDATKQAALATVIFGKGGVEMSRILDQGRASLDKFKQTAKGLGIIIPDDLLQKAGELDDKLDVLSKVIDVQLGEALINAGPGLVAFTSDIAGLSREINGISKAMTEFSNNPSASNFRDLLSQITGLTIIPGSFADKVINGPLKFSSADTSALENSIKFVETKLAELKQQAEQGADVKLEIDEATANLNDLKAKLAEIQGAAGAAANTITGQFAQAFRAAENASMDALAAMQGGSGGALPTVTRYGSNPNKITLPQQDYTDQSNVNGSGVNVRKYNPVPQASGDYAPNGKPIIYLKPGQAEDSFPDGINAEFRRTTDNTELTADNVSKLDANTKRYLDGLSRDIGGYSQQQMAQQTVAISKLSEVASWMKLDSYSLAALVHNNDSGATGVGKTMFGDAFDPQYGSYISSWGVGKTTRPSVKFPTTSSDGNYGTSVNVQQPGNPITFNYTAAPGVSNETAKQQALDMYYTMTTAAARA